MFLESPISRGVMLFLQHQNNNKKMHIKKAVSESLGSEVEKQHTHSRQKYYPNCEVIDHILVPSVFMAINNVRGSVMVDTK